MADVFLIVTLSVWGVAVIAVEIFLGLWMPKRVGVGSGPTQDNRDLGVLMRSQEAEFAATCGATYHVPGQRRPKRKEEGGEAASPELTTPDANPGADNSGPSSEHGKEEAATPAGEAALPHDENYQPE